MMGGNTKVIGMKGSCTAGGTIFGQTDKNMKVSTI